MKILLLLSGGLDSATLLYEHKTQGEEVRCAMFDYGQSHLKELDFARWHCRNLGVQYTEVQLSKIQGLFKHSCITGDPNAGPVIPNRNAVLLHIAASLALGMRFEAVSIGCNQDDAKEFPDCRHDFIEAMNATLKCADLKMQVITPYIGLTKWQIVRRAKELGVDFEKTWSCYEGFATPCRMCLACRLRQEAMK